MNKYLDEQIKYFFGKSFDEMSEDEKLEITSLTLSSENFRGESNNISISELVRIPNLQRCLLQGFDLTDDDISILKKISTLRGIQFFNCNFEGIKSSLGNVELVIIDSCRNVPSNLLSGVDSIKYLRVVNQNYFDASVLQSCVTLERVYLQKTVILNLNGLRKLQNLKLVNLDGSKFNLLALHQLKSDMNVEYKRIYTPEPDR